MKKILKRNKIKWLDLKKFRHFDKPHKTYVDIKDNPKYCNENTKSCNKVKNVVSDPDEVAKHSFYPFIAFEINERKISKIKAQRERIKFLKRKIEEGNQESKLELNSLEQNFRNKIIKKRPIKYASHMDGHIYSYYASSILQKYEEKVKEYDLDKEVLAYRKSSEGEPHNNITMAKDLFTEIINRNCNCVALAYDLKSFYDNIDHKKLKELWCKVLGVEQLPPDHYNIYKSLTKFCYVDLKDICKYFNYESCCKTKKYCDCNLCNKPKLSKLPKCLFKNASDFHKFKQKLGKDIFKKNEGLKDKENPYGIPQGSALSSVLSNIYMLNFDIAVKKYVKDLNGIYRRYCDDIIIICNIQNKDKIDLFLREEIKQTGSHLEIHKIEEGYKYSKSQIYDFNDKEKIKQKPLQYLGFCFDGNIVTIRGSSLARYYRKAHNGVIAMRLSALKNMYNIVKNGEKLNNNQNKLYRKKLYERYTPLGKNNFFTYVDRAFKDMAGVDNTRIRKQLSNHLKKLKQDIDYENLYIKNAWDYLSENKELPDFKTFLKRIKFDKH